eukprot:759750-Hanusia_phi.AAC.2
MATNSSAPTAISEPLIPSLHGSMGWYRSPLPPLHTCPMVEIAMGWWPPLYMILAQGTVLLVPGIIAVRSPAGAGQSFCGQVNRRRGAVPKLGVCTAPPRGPGDRESGPGGRATGLCLGPRQGDDRTVTETSTVTEC